MAYQRERTIAKAVRFHSRGGLSQFNKRRSGFREPLSCSIWMYKECDRSLSVPLAERDERQTRHGVFLSFDCDQTRACYNAKDFGEVFQSKRKERDKSLVLSGKSAQHRLNCIRVLATQQVWAASQFCVSASQSLCNKY
jgi:hypothetical protein